MGGCLLGCEGPSGSARICSQSSGYNEDVVTPAELAVQIVRFVDECQPGIVECEFDDAKGRRHTLVDKVPIFSADLLDADSAYPQPGLARCTIVRTWCDVHGRELLTVNTADPDGIESTEGLTEFVVTRSQISAPHEEAAKLGE
jgi:hypothetical protein